MFLILIRISITGDDFFLSGILKPDFWWGYTDFCIRFPKFPKLFSGSTESSFVSKTSKNILVFGVFGSLGQTKR